MNAPDVDINPRTKPRIIAITTPIITVFHLT
jgi:hypothetical protein